jgi:peptidoglycan hydrolase-like protein with peptidoglycan-binding domain
MPPALAERLRRAKPASAERSSFAEDGPPPDEPGPRRRRVRIAAIATILLAAAATVAVVALGSGSSSHGSQGSVIPPGDTTATVERRTLVEHAQVNGTLGYGATLEMYDRIAGTFTWLPSVGAVIGRGGTLWRMDNLPVVLMYGSLPAYRALAQGVSDGPDVAQLNSNLIALGFDPYRAIGDRRHFGEAAATAVRRWQKANGLPQTGKVELGRVLFAPAARRVTAVHVALGQDPPGASESSPGSGSGSGSGSGTPTGSSEPASKPPAAKHRPAHHSSKAPSSRTPSANRKPVANSHPRGSSSERSAKESSAAANPSKKNASNGNPSKEGSSKEPNGSGGGAPKLVLGTTSTQQIVQLQVKANQQQLARVGEKAPVTLPDGRTVQGHITNVGTVASESSESEKGSGNGRSPENGSGNGENATIAVTLALDRAVARLDKAPVSVQLVKSISRDVLAVPATALVATAAGGYAIQALEGGRRVELPVTPGMFANGYVQIEGAGVHEGLTVLEPR